MKSKIILLIAVAFSASLSAGGQSIKRINEIKKNYNYLWAEATMASSEAAYQVANEYLAQKVKEYAAQKNMGKDFLTIKNISSKSETLSMPRGDMVKVFIYIKKTDIAPADAVVPLGPRPAQTDVQPPVQDIASAPVREPVTTPSAASRTKLPESWQQDVIDDLLASISLAEARGKLAEMKRYFKISKYGVPAACRDSESVFWIIGDPSSGKIVALLGPGTDGQRTDFRTLSVGALSAYRNYDAVWFILSK